MGKLSIKKIGECGVDSGQLFVIDPCYLDRYKDTEHDAPIENDEELSYASVCKATLDSREGGQVGGRAGGVAFTTGLGDGCYPVYAIISDEKEWGTRVAGVFIDFGLVDLNPLDYLIK